MTALWAPGDARAGSLEQSTPLPEILRERRRALELGARLVEPAELFEQVRARAREQMVAAKRGFVGQRIERFQPDRRSLGHRAGHRAVQAYDRGPGDGIELAVEGSDPRPVRLVRRSRPRVARRDRGLERVPSARAREALGPSKLGQSVLDEGRSE